MVSNVAEILDIEPEPEELEESIDTDAKKSGKAVVIKTTSR